MGDICKTAALRAYYGLRTRGRGEFAAFDAAVAVYRFHHPKTPSLNSIDLVDEWIEESQLNQARPS